MTNGTRYQAEIDFGFEESAPAACGAGCGWSGTAGSVAEIGECSLTPGDPSPVGRCPECDALAYLDAPAKPATGLNPRLYAFLIAWHDRDMEQGTYGWAGEADSEEAALALAYAEMAEAEPDAAPYDSDGSPVLQSWHGWNPWQAPAEPESTAALLSEAVNAWQQFDSNGDVNGGDLVEWFAEWRERAKAAVAGKPVFNAALVEAARNAQALNEPESADDAYEAAARAAGFVQSDAPHGAIGRPDDIDAGRFDVTYSSWRECCEREGIDPSA